MKPTWFSYPDRDSAYDEYLCSLVSRADSIAKWTDLPKTFLRRYEIALGYNAPFLKAAIPDISRKRAIEVGCGAGSKVSALSHLFREYWGADLSAPMLKKADKLISALGIENATLTHTPATETPQLLNSQQFDVIILFAVLEHLTIDEKLNLLRECWSALPPGGYLYFAEAPNRASPVDLHSSRLPQFNQLPLDLARLYYERSKTDHWLRHIKDGNASDVAFYRNGVHIGFHEFELAFGSTNFVTDHLVAHNFHPHLLNLYPVLWFEDQLWKNLEVFARPSVEMQATEVSPIFSRYWIEGILQKGDDVVPRKVAKLSRGHGTRGTPRNVGHVSGYQLLDGDQLQLELPASKPEATSVTIGLHRIGSEGQFEVTDSKGSILLETSWDEITSAKPPHRDSQHFMSLPTISRERWPIAIRPKGTGSKLLVLQPVADFLNK